jgi:predicted SAM-dependent methyltransferase/SAM-dependent methyltransferase
MSGTLRRLANAAIRKERGLPRGAMTPEIATDLFQTHASLYHFAARFADGRRVLDYGCRTGFGAAILERGGAREVVGVDSDERQLQYAREHAATTRTRFAAEIGGGVERFDLIVAFNALDGDAAGTVARLRERLLPGGTLVFNVPPQQGPHGASPDARTEWLALLGGIPVAVHHHLPPEEAKPDLASSEWSRLRADDFRFPVAEGKAPVELASLVFVVGTPPIAAERLHIGSGPVQLPGWINVDNQAYPGVPYVLDVTKEMPFTGARFVFAEHFIEHLAIDDGLRFLTACRAVLRDDGVLRLSTPNLDWVLATQYVPAHWTRPDDAIYNCILLNRGFHGWGHQFLYNAATLEHLLRAAGFATVTQCAYRESAHPELHNLEQHEPSPDAPGLPHVIVMEASGRAAPVALNPAYAEFMVAFRHHWLAG